MSCFRSCPAHTGGSPLRPVQRLVQRFRPGQHEASSVEQRKTASVRPDHLDSSQLIVWDRDVRVASVVCLRRVGFADQRVLVVLGGDPLSVRVKGRIVLLSAVAGIAQREVRTRLLSDQNRQIRLDSVPPRHPVGGGIRSDRKFADRQRSMMKEDVLADIAFPLLRIIEIAASRVRCHPVPDPDPEIAELIALEKDPLHMEKTVCPLKCRRSEDLPHRNIHIRETVLEIRLLRGIGQRMQRHRQIRLVAVPSRHMNRLSLIQRIDQFLLNRPVHVLIQRIHPDRFPENALEILPDGRNRKIDDRKAPFLFGNIPLPDQKQRLPQLRLPLRRLAVQTNRAAVHGGHEGRRAEGFQHRRTRMLPGQIRRRLIRLLSN